MYNLSDFDVDIISNMLKWEITNCTMHDSEYGYKFIISGDEIIITEYHYSSEVEENRIKVSDFVKIYQK